MSAGGTVTLSPFVPADLDWLFLEPVQQAWLGATSPVLDEDYGRAVLECGPCWTARDGNGWVLGAGGFQEFGRSWDAANSERGGGYAIAWGLVAQGVGRDHLALTRLVRAKIAEAPYGRVEALIRADWPPARRWARMLGLRPVPHGMGALADGFWTWCRPQKPTLRVAA
jgi:hypothetical protein